MKYRSTGNRSSLSVQVEQLVQSFSSGCPEGPLLTVSPIKPEELLLITPLGNLNPPDHTLPTDHIYLVVKQTNEIVPGSARTVVAPGRLTIESIRHQTAYREGVLFSDDYALDFSSCSQVRANFGHVTKLAGKVAAALNDDRARCETHNPRPADTYTYCRLDVRVQLEPGEVIGEAGGGTATGLDWQVVDWRRSPLAYANPKRYREDAWYFACPLDLFDQTLRNQLLDRVAGYDGRPRTIEPRCGAVNQDIPGTAQGNWFTGGLAIAADSPETWQNGLALVHDNAEPTIGVISIGGVVGQSQKIAFKPQETGQINREFSTIKPGDMIYCYQTDTPSHLSSLANERLLIQLLSPTKLKVELQNGACQDSHQFDKAIGYER